VLDVRGQGSGVTHHASCITHHASRITRYAILAVLFILLMLGFWFFLSPRDDGSLAEIQRRGALRVGLDASFPPFETVDANGQIVGLDVDIARAIAADLGVEAELVNIGFDGLYDALLARRVDLIISGLPYDPRWTEDVAYTSNYFNAGQVLVTRADDQAIKSVEDLAGRTVAVEWGSQAEMEARRLAQKLAMNTSPSPPTPLPQGEGSILTLLRQDSAAAALEAVRSGQADAAIVDAPSALSLLSPSPLQGEGRGGGLKILTYLTDEWYAAAVHIQSRELLAAANQTLVRLAESGEMAKLQARWFRGAGG
jgi:ABC-type amino acid transport substrate-binding protein